MSASNLVERFIGYLQIEKRYSNHTLIAYENDLLQFANFAELAQEQHWMEVGHHLIRGWMVNLLEQSVGARSVGRKLSSLRSFFGWMKREGRINENPMLKIRGPKVEKRLPQFVKQSEVTEERIGELFGNNFEGLRDRLMLELFYQTGVRLSELINLKESDVTPSYIKVLGKRNKERIIPIGQQLADLIHHYRSVKPREYDAKVLLFVKSDGKKLYPKLVYRKINAYLGVVSDVQKKSPHVLRHTFATHLLNNGAGLETLKELLGHANLSATQVYTHNSFTQINNIYSQAHPRGRKN